MSTLSRDVSRMPRESLRISSVEEPGWSAETGRIPIVGEWVHCTDGYAKVVRVLGRCGDGSRLLELSFPGEKRPAFFAASSNVLLRSDGHTDAGGDVQIPATPPESPESPAG